MKALHEAIRREDIEAVRALLDAGARLTRRWWQRRGHAPLAAAAHNKGVAIATLLLDRGADPNAGNPLFQAAYCGNVEMMALLVARGAEVNPAGKIAPLNVAATRRNLDAIDWLLAHGADPSRALEANTHRMSLEVLQRLVAAGGVGDPALMDAVRRGTW